MSFVFLTYNRSEPLESAKFAFDRTLLEEYRGKLKADVVEVNDLTIEHLKTRYVIHFGCILCWHLVPTYPNILNNLYLCWYVMSEIGSICSGVNMS